MNDLIQALERISAIENSFDCGDWDEIELARTIANEALSRYRSSVEGVELPEPDAAQSKFTCEAAWSSCAVGHHLSVQADPSGWRDYETRALYTATTVRTLIAQEREACAKVCEQSDEEGEGPDSWGWHSKDFAKAIRARGNK